MSEPVDHLVTRAGGVATIALNRPAAYNALTADLLDSLLQTLTALERDRSVRAIVVTGTGKGFCAGQALDDARSLPPGERPDIGRSVHARYNPLLIKLLTIEKPTIAAVNGVAAGAGFGLALACDLRVVATTASFTTAFAKIGLVPDSGISFMLPLIVGYGRALELCLLSERIDAQRADALGIATTLAEPNALMERATALAQQLATGPRSLGLIKRELLRNAVGDVAAKLAYEGELQTVAGESSDFLEGLAAFAGKRAPQFTGA